MLLYKRHKLLDKQELLLLYLRLGLVCELLVNWLLSYNVIHKTQVL